MRRIWASTISFFNACCLTRLEGFACLNTRQQVVLDDEGSVDGGVDAVEADRWGGWDPNGAGVDEEGEGFGLVSNQRSPSLDSESGGGLSV